MSLRKKLWLAPMVLMLPLSPQSLWAANELVNPGFELPAGNASTPPDNWVATFGGVLARSNTAFAGSFSGRIESAQISPTTYVARFTNSICRVVSPGEEFLVRAYARVESSGAGVTCLTSRRFTQANDCSGASTGLSGGSTPVNDTSWTLITSSPSGAPPDRNSLEFGITCTSSAPFVVLLDEAEGGATPVPVELQSFEIE